MTQKSYNICLMMDCSGWCRAYGAGGYAKDTTQFSEFIRADFLRNRIKRTAVVADFDKALKQALVLAKGADAGYLPGWCGPIT